MIRKDMRRISVNVHCMASTTLLDESCPYKISRVNQKLS